MKFKLFIAKQTAIPLPVPFEPVCLCKSDDSNEFSLYANKDGAKEATKEGKKIVDQFASKWRSWQQKHKKLGATDSDSRDAFLDQIKSKID